MTIKISWKILLRIISAAVFLVALAWVYFQPGFEPIITLLSAISAFLGSFLMSDASIFSETNREISTIQQIRNREKMLGKVESFWIDGVLKNSLHGAALIELGFSFQSNHVGHPWEMVLYKGDRLAESVAKGTSIADIFVGTDRALLILGEPGGGKTTTLLELTRSLLQQAKADTSVPMPVVFNLSSWAYKKLTIAEWLVDELNVKYQIPRPIATEWICNDSLTLLLDGLDEVGEGSRKECVLAINQYRLEHFVDVVVCSRIADYEVLDAKLGLNNAVVIQPLSDDQIKSFFFQFGNKLKTAKNLVRRDVELRKMVTTPLFLSIISLAYMNMPMDKAQIGKLNAIERRKHLFDVYVRQMLKRRGKHKRYSISDTLKWTTWLAHNLQKKSQTIFYIEQLRYDWLPEKVAEWKYHMIAALLALPLVAIATGAANAFFFYSLRNKFDHHVITVFASTALALCSVVWFGANRLLNGISGIIVGVTGGLAFLAPSLPFTTTKRAILIWIIAGLVIGITFSKLRIISSRLKSSFQDSLREIHIIEALSWSWRNVLRGLVRGFMVIIVLAITSGVIVSLSLDLRSGIILGIAGAVAMLSIIAVGSGLRGTMIESRTVPNQGIKRTARMAILVSVITGVASGLAIGIAGILLFGFNKGLLSLLTYFLFGMSVGGITYGGFACFQHIALRTLLYRNGYIPYDYAAFLDYTSSCLITQKVGGGYIFIHRYLLDHLAEAADNYRELAKD